MGITSEQVAHPELVSGEQTSQHSHVGGGNGADVKSGSLVVSGKTWTAVMFATAFASVPSVIGALTVNATWSLRSITTTGFEVYVNVPGDSTLLWIATDVGNP